MFDDNTEDEKADGSRLHASGAGDTLRTGTEVDLSDTSVFEHRSAAFEGH